MGAALHLAHVYEPPPPPKKKPKGGGGNGQKFYEYATRIYSDDRANGEARELLLAVAYAVCTAPPNDGPAQWKLVRQCLGEKRIRHLGSLVEKDVPRYISPEYQPGGWDNLKRLCVAPRIRPYKSRPLPGATAAQIAAQAREDEQDFRNVRKICGNTASDYATEKLPGTGWHKLHYFCAAHRDHLLRVRAQVAECNKLAPEPIPNSGGLLPSYFDADWVKVYRHYWHGSWQAPVYGIRADDWPVPGRDPIQPRVRLRLAALDGELLTNP